MRKGLTWRVLLIALYGLTCVCTVNAAEIVIGFCGALSGRAAAYGTSVTRGARLAVTRLNETGNEQDHRFRFVAVDDEQQETLTSERVTALIYDERAQALIGTTDSGCTHVAARIALKARVPLLATVATDPTLTRLNNAYVFRNLADDRIQGRRLVEFIVQNERKRRVVVAHVNTRYGRGGATVVEVAARLSGTPLLERLSFDTGQTDFTAIVNRLKQLRADGLIIWGLYAEGAALTVAVRRAIPRLSIYGPDGLAAPAFIKEAGSAAEGVVVTYPFNPDQQENPIIASFVEAYQQTYGGEPDSFAAHAFDAVYMIADAAKRRGPSAAQIRDGLASMVDFHGVTGVSTFDEQGNSTLPVFLARVEKGRFRLRTER